MKKIISIFLILIVILTSFFGCNTYNKESNTDTDEILSITSDSDESSLGEIHNEPLYKKDINVHSLEELSKMREMLLDENEDQLNEYLEKMYFESGSSIEEKMTKKDIETFIALADSLPFVNVVDGGIAWINHNETIIENSENAVETFYIALEAENGDWIRYEYFLSEENLLDYITEETQVFDKPLTGTNQRITLLAERRKPHSSGVGEMVIWTATIDEMSAYIFQYSTVVGQIKADAIINGNLITAKDLK